MRWPLRNQIFVPFGALMLSVLIVVSAVNAYLAAHRATDQIVQQIERIARSMQASNYPLSESILQQTRALSGAEFMVTDQTGNVLASSLPAPAVFGAAQPPTAAAAGLPQTTDVLGQRYFQAVIRTERGQQRTPQLLHILYPERIWREARWQATYPPLLVGALALAVVFGLSIAIAGRLSRPILQLQAQVGRIAQGHFEPLPPAQRDDELGDLIAAVNALVADLVAYSQALKRSERLTLMGQLSGGLAHHLRNAVAGAKLALQLHQRSCRDIDQESLAVAQRQLRLTEEQLQRFLTAGQPQTPHRSPCQVTDLVAELSTLVGPICQHRKVVLRCEPPPTRLPEVSADPGLLHQALLNLVLNAIEAAAPHGWVQIETRVDTQLETSSPGEGELVIRVFDSGPGPPAELRPRLFEPFATGRPEGLGLGLTAARQIAAAHEGRVLFAGDQPTCFELRLPIAVKDPECKKNRGAIA